MSEEKKYTAIHCSGVEGPSLYLNDYRVAGPKPWGGGQKVKEWTFSFDDLARAIPEIATLTADLAAARAERDEAVRRADSFEEMSRIDLERADTYRNEFIAAQERERAAIQRAEAAEKRVEDLMRLADVDATASDLLCEQLDAAIADNAALVGILRANAYQASCALAIEPSEPGACLELMRAFALDDWPEPHLGSALLARLRAAEGLATYGSHTDRCDIDEERPDHAGTMPCSCGYEAALAAWEAAR